MAEMARVYLINHDPGIVEISTLVANTAVDFCDTTTLWCPNLNPVPGRYGTSHKSKERCYGTLA